MTYEILQILDGDESFIVIEESDDLTRANIRVADLMKEHRGNLYIVRPKQGE